MLDNVNEIENLFDELFPIPRSITGDGYRKSLEILKRFIPLSVEKIPSGKKVFDWTVPSEWVIRDGYILDPHDNKIVDYKINPLSVVNYSIGVNKNIQLEELKKHLHSIPSNPDWTPYVTSYYKENWGFCIPDNIKSNLMEGEYTAYIDAEHAPGYVEYGTLLLKNNCNTKRKRNTILISSYLCHPNMANNELSGPILLAAVYQKLLLWERREFDYLFVINPETIGSICLLSKMGEELKNALESGIVLTCMGGSNEKITYKLSRSENSSLDLLFKQLHSEGECDLRPFDPSEGSDERQYCSSEFNLPVGQLAKTKYGAYPEYHTSADNKEFVRLETIPSTLAKLEEILWMHENLSPLKRYEPFCEIQLGKRGLYPNIKSPETWGIGSDNPLDTREQLKCIQYILSYSDEKHNLLDIAKLTNVNIKKLVGFANILREKKLIY